MKNSSPSVKETEKKQQTVRLNYLRIAPRKVRLVGDLIKGLPVNEAEAQLLLQKRRAAKPLLKLLRSAVASARNNKLFESDNLYIESLRVDQGPMLKRIMPRARGVATPIHKKMSHITLVLAENFSSKPPRFKLAVIKKDKKHVAEEGKTKKEKKVEKKPVEAATQRQNPGFFKRIFRRKSV